MTDRQTDRPINQPTDGQTGSEEYFTSNKLVREENDVLIIYTKNKLIRPDYFLSNESLSIISIQERLKEDKVKKEHGAKKERVPKWSKEAFNDKLKKVKCTLEEGRDLRKNHKIGKDYIYLSPLFSLFFISLSPSLMPY